MPKIADAPQSPSPSLQGSAPVSEVLNRILVQDPRRKYAGMYARRLTDFESQLPLVQTATDFAVAAMVVGICWFAFVQVFIKNWNADIPAIPTMTMNHSPVATSPPKVIPQPRKMTPPPPEIAIQPGKRPENLHASFLGPRTVELRWDSLGTGYVYRVYAAGSSTLQDAQLLSENPVEASRMTWMPQDNIQSAWVVIKGIDPQGRETAFSSPLLIQLPM